MPSDPIPALIQTGAVAALVFVTYGFLWGPVFAKRTVEMLLAAKDAIIAQKDAEIAKESKRADEWQTRYERRDEQAFELAEKVARLTNALDHATSRLATDGRREP
jgi:hypothetical protein